MKISGLLLLLAGPSCVIASSITTSNHSEVGFNGFTLQTCDQMTSCNIGFSSPSTGYSHVSSSITSTYDNIMADASMGTGPVGTVQATAILIADINDVFTFTGGSGMGTAELTLLRSTKATSFYNYGQQYYSFAVNGVTNTYQLYPPVSVVDSFTIPFVFGTPAPLNISLQVNAIVVDVGTPIPTNPGMWEYHVALSLSDVKITDAGGVSSPSYQFIRDSATPEPALGVPLGIVAVYWYFTCRRRVRA